jgi:hypothetical protein
MNKLVNSLECGVKFRHIFFKGNHSGYGFGGVNATAEALSVAFRKVIFFLIFQKSKKLLKICKFLFARKFSVL